MSFMDDLKRWAKGEDDDDLEEEELEVVSNGPGRSRTVRTEERPASTFPLPTSAAAATTRWSTSTLPPSCLLCW